MTHQDSFIQSAFEGVCKDAKTAQGYYVSLMSKVPFFGGPEEGGWWGSDTHLVAYKWFATEEEAAAAKAAVMKLAVDLSQEARRDFALHCANQMDWLEERGLDADFFPEVDGESKFLVIMSEGLPEESRGDRQYS